ncbi:hypothetical protein FACS189437_05910 [Bacteroidia bacterium]|nr:hypothetical protein FACS189437_05910 [Bacteroidia bacterium]
MKKTLSLLCAAALLSGCVATGNAPYCNQYVIALMKQKNIYLPQTSANGLDNYLKNSKEWARVPRVNGRLDHAAAHKAAKKGRTVLAAYNTGTGRSGHIAEVYGKKAMRKSTSFNAFVPYVNGTVNGSKPAVMLMSQQFHASKERQINYYIYKK